MTRLLFLTLILAFNPDRGPTRKHRHIRIERRGILYNNGRRWDDLTIENNSKDEATVIYRGQHFTAPRFSTTTWEP